jgi:hypothetical protein
MKNREDEYSYHFTVEYDDGTEMSVSIEAQYKNGDEEHYAYNQVEHENQDCNNIIFNGCERNY